ncbi:tyrosine-type recombinase/integrase [Bradyrhizobium jicamae]|uniref:tyrosine-type recombinase/integrase n=1 Tax=Bradyrhizobium jicamae TaxID=280332 RepID=UPI001FD9977F|nr:tyrosine-type recombinase/integrase [Bradyrhizobium jicamae]
MMFAAPSMLSARRRRSTFAIRAVLLLLATTGIRNGELRALQFQDIDWRAGEIFVRRTKGKRDRVAPLLEEAGAALANYILRARPKVDISYLFLSFTSPVGPFTSASPVSRIVRKRLRHGGVALGRVGWPTKGKVPCTIGTT